MTKPTLITRSTFLAQAGAALLALLGGSDKTKAAETPPAGGTKKKYTMVVLTNATAGKDAEFNEWYTNRHLHDVLKVPGIIGAQRFKLAVNPSPTGPSWHYYAAYEMETDDPKATVDDLVKRYGTDKMPMSDSMDKVSFFSVYESITPVVKA